MDNRQEMCAKILTVWCFNTNNDKIMFDPEYEKISFIAKVLRKKMEAFGIDIKLPDPLIMLIEICTDSNPGISQLILKRVMSFRSRVEKENVVTPIMFVAAFGDSFPLMEDPKWNKIFQEEWDRQKDENGHNKCDTPEWWRDFQ